MFNCFCRTAAAFCGALIFVGILPHWLKAEQPPAVETIDVQEVKDEAAEESDGSIALSEVEASRKVTTDRIYGLVGLWTLIALGVLLIRYQVREDERLYQEGYYSKKLE